MTKIIGIISDFVENDTTILKTSFYRTRQTYINYVQKCCDNKTIIIFIPYLKKQINEYINLCDGIILVGGNDIPTNMYGEKKLFKNVNENKTRFTFEVEFIKKYIKTNKPLLGICAGMQSINIALDGSLYQDIQKQIKTKINHSQKNNFSKPIHEVFIEKNTKLSNIIKCEKISTNSMHHQAIKKLGKNIVTSAKTKDGIIEAIELLNHKFCIGVQWHPEFYSCDKDLNICKNFCKCI